jgi:lactose/L-arabinose transport system ATP-binding protein
VRLPDYENRVVPTTVKATNGTAVTVGIRPEHFKSGGSAALPLTVDIVEHLGGETYAYARHGNGDLLTLATNNARDVASGDAYEARFDPPSMLIFNTEGQRIR